MSTLPSFANPLLLIFFIRSLVESYQFNLASDAHSPTILRYRCICNEYVEGMSKRMQQQDAGNKN